MERNGRIGPVMIFAFGGDERFTASRPPLIRAMVDVRFPTVAAFAELPALAPIQDMLEAAFPLMTQATAEHGERPETSWLFQDENAGYRFELGPSALRVSVPGTGYRDREAFQVVLEQVLDAVDRSRRVKKCTSIEVRFVDGFKLETGWGDWLQPAIVGWSEHPGVVQLRRRSLSTTTLGGAIDVEHQGELPATATVKSGIVGAIGNKNGINVEGPAFVIDCSVRLAEEHDFDPAELGAIFRACNHEIARFFNFALTESGRAHFGVERG